MGVYNIEKSLFHCIENFYKRAQYNKALTYSLHESLRDEFLNIVRDKSKSIYTAFLHKKISDSLKMHLN